eukprot:CAMPEP_0198238160 /NCGR_PEP_ID=MMETSP1446-20131203/3886_1 /TAXON_ID=1461542 ORGANISM="Unidentified sp, Strain CCMP2111" /NCGR_SAMPLE_ID=MMETSP1446 /ASSEMBLY_ACC=CAM_ASM_001112 /LENGTH=388 /DNA_ID=CAMNT_0043920519 /DNA_START=92 /DNA_END=1254 /DNA_ORIENTATION=+
MFESKLAALLGKYLGEYVHGLDGDDLKVSVWKGDVVLKNLKLKSDALKVLGIPGLVVKAGLLGSLTLKLPWNKLGSEPVVVEFDRIYILAALDNSGKGNLAEDLDEANVQEKAYKRRRVDAAVSQWLKQNKSKSKSDDGSSGGGYFGGVIQTVLGNLQLSFTNLHIRVEDPYWGISFHFTIQELSGITVDESGKPTFVTSGYKEHLRKLFKLRKMTVYCDSQSQELVPDEPWEDLSGDAWDDFFLPHIEATSDNLSCWFLLRPVDANLTYERTYRTKASDTSHIDHRLNLSLDEISLSSSQMQYLSIQRMLQTFELLSTRAAHFRYRPYCTIAASPRSWWRYAVDTFVAKGLIQAPSSAKGGVFRMVLAMRKRYIEAYVNHLRNDAST